MKNKTLSLTIGLPVFNEEANIINLLQSLLRQNQTNFTLKEIIIIDDFSTDKTTALIKDFQRNNPQVELIENQKREGKAARLNQLYAMNKSELLLTLDADILIYSPDDVSLMVDKFNDKKVQVVGGNITPIKPHGVIPMLLYTYSVLWDEIRTKIDNGDHIANLYGSATMLRKSFAEKIVYPKNITCDEEYLYLLAKKQDGFAYAHNTKIYCVAVSTIADLRLLGTRLLRERESLYEVFGKEAVTEAHRIPFHCKVNAIAVYLLKSPFYTIGALFLNLALRLFPRPDSLNNKGMWLQVKSTKKRITTAMVQKIQTEHHA